jgi:AAA domain
MQSRALLIRGHQGVGKTTVSERLAEDHGFCRLSKDALYVPIRERYGEHRAASDIAYIGLCAFLESNPRSGISFVVDAPFNGPLSASNLLSDLSGWGFLAKSVLLVCSDHTAWEERLRQRGETLNHSITSLGEILAYRGTLEATPLEGELVLDTAPEAATINELARQCADYLHT